jgi:hypothetical protein
MAIDIRATVTCSLGTLISGSISDDYIQGSGLVKTRGSIELNGIVTPAEGTVVTFSYTKGGVTRTIPRKLRVMSSFADPFRRTTKVELGCKLTYLSDLKPAPTVEGDSDIETGKRQQCLNGYSEYPADAPYGVPISAAALMNRCLTRLGITASSNPLTNRFSQDTFDMTPGYVTVLGDLLLSESYCGYLNSNEVLQVFSLDQSGGTGPVVDSSKIIDLEGIGLGDRPGDAVVVRYQSLKYKEDLETEDTNSNDYKLRNWEYEDSTGDPEFFKLRYTSTAGTVLEPVYGYTPFTSTVTEYGQDLSWDDDSCVISSGTGEQPDLSNSAVKRTTNTRVLKAAAAGDYCAKLLGAGYDPGAGVVGLETTIEEYEYDSKGLVTRESSKTYEPFFAWAGRLNLEFVFPGPSVVTLPSTQVLVREVVTDIETIYAPTPIGTVLKAGEKLEPSIAGEKRVTSSYVNWGLSQQGQQAIAGIGTNAAFTTAQEVADYLNSIANTTVLEDRVIKTNRNRVTASVETRPSASDRLINSTSAQNNTESTSELIYATGSALGERIIELSMPYQSDDYYTATGTLVKGDAAAKASRYGRCQNRLLLGNRYGMNLQLAPETLPAAPFSPLVVQANGLSALYRVNGTNWQLSSDGVLVSTDALFWGAVGGTGTFWFPVAPGVTALPATPPVVSGEMTVSNVVPVWNETVLATGSVRVGVGVQRLGYALEVLTAVSVATRVSFGAQKLLKIEPPATNVIVATAAPQASIGASVVTPTTNVSVSGSAPLASTGAATSPPCVDIGITAALPDYIGSATVIQPMPADMVMVAETPAVIANGLPVPSANTAVSALAPDVVAPADTYFDNVALLLHMDGAQDSTTFVDSSKNNITVTTASAVSPRISNYAPYIKYGSGGGDFRTVRPVALKVVGRSELNLGGSSGSWTVEGWYLLMDGGTNQGVFSNQLQDGETSGYGWLCYFARISSTNWSLGLYGRDDSGQNLLFAFSSAFPVGVYTHVAVTFDGTSARIFVDGVLKTTVAKNSNAFSGVDEFYIGQAKYGPSGTVWRNAGTIDDFRVTVGVCRYTSSFTPPTAAYPNG